MSKAIEKTIEQRPALHASLRERLEAGHRSAKAAWSAKARMSLKETFLVLNEALANIERHVSGVEDEEDALRVRAQLGDLLRQAAAAVSPRSM